MVFGNGNYFLKWNEFEENSRSTFKDMRNDTDFTDMTLVCDDYQEIEGHKVILSTSSIFFDKIFRKSKHPHPLIYLRGVKSRDMMSILDFMYHGEVSIPQEDLEEFMHTARELNIKGLEGNEAGKNTSESQDKYVCDNEIPQTESLYSKSETHIKVEQTDVTNVLVSEESGTNHIPKDGKSIVKDLESLDMIIDSMIQKAEGTGFTCKVCGIPRITTQSLKVHVEGKHVTGFSHPCLKCNNGKSYKSRKSLRGHLFNKHKMSEKSK